MLHQIKLDAPTGYEFDKGDIAIRHVSFWNGKAIYFLVVPVIEVAVEQNNVEPQYPSVLGD